MYLSADLIYEELKKHYIIQRNCSPDPALTLGSVFFYKKGLKLKKECVYLVKEDAAAADEGLFIYLGKGNGRGFCILSDTDILEVFNILQNLFDYYNSWDERLEKITHESADIGQMLLESAPIIGSPMFAFNVHMELVGAVGFKSDLPNSWYIYTPADISPDDLARLKGIAAAPGFTDETFFLQTDGKKNVFGANLFLQGKYNGTLFMIESAGKDLSARHKLLIHLKKYIEDAVFHHSFANHAYITSIETALDKMLSGNSGYESRISENITQLLGIGGKDISWLVVVLRPEDGMIIGALQYLSAAIGNLMPSNISFYHESNIVCLICCPDEKQIEASLAVMKDPMEKISISIGISNIFYSLEGFAGAYNQAVCAVETALSIGKSDVIYHFSDYLLTYMLQKARGVFKTEDLLNSGIRKLIEHDKKREISYIETLSCFLSHNMNLSASAKALFLHRSSLEQRLESIYELLGSRLEDESERLYYRMILQMMKEESRLIL